MAPLKLIAVLVTPPRNCKLEISATWPATGFTTNNCQHDERGTSSIRTDRFVPVPFTDTPFKVTVCVQTFVPAGNCTVSPGSAVATALLTSNNELLAALIMEARPDGFRMNRISATDAKINLDL